MCTSRFNILCFLPMRKRGLLLHYFTFLEPGEVEAAELGRHDRDGAAADAKNFCHQPRLCPRRWRTDRRRKKGDNQCDQIWRFLKIVGNNFACKSSPKTLVTFWAILKVTLHGKTAVTSIWATFRDISATFYSNTWSHWWLLNDGNLYAVGNDQCDQIVN